MITHIATQAVYVSDQLAARDFWTEQVGFEVAAQHDMGGGSFWLEVAPPGAQSRIVLYPRPLMKGWENKNPSIVFQCDDVARTYHDLKQRGVRVGPAPTKMQWGTFATFQDPDGNEFVIKS